jgi:predicted DNA-binding transcriptional regulator AlpA
MKKRNRKKRKVALARICRAAPPVYRPDDPLLKAEDAAVETGRAISTFWRDVRDGILPPPYYVMPKTPRWRRSDLRSVIDASPRAPGRKARLVQVASLKALVGASVGLGKSGS